MSLRQFLAGLWQLFSGSTIPPAASLPELDPNIVLSVPRFAAELVRGIAVEKKDQRTVMVCERPLLPHQPQLFESFAGVSAAMVEFVSDPEQYAHLRPFIAQLRTHYYGQQEQESCGCRSYYSLVPNLTPRPPLSTTCPRLDPRIVEEMIPRHLKEWRMLPVEKVGDRLVIMCEQPVSPEHREMMEFIYNRSGFEFVSDPQRYPEVRSHFDELLEYHSWQPYFEDGVLEVD